MTATPTTELARFFSALRYEDIPERIRERSKDLLLDAIACAIAGRDGEETSQVRALARALGGSQEASVIGEDRLSTAGATIFNGYLVTAVTVCDVYRPSHCHVTPVVVPPALAIAERDGLDGRALLTAMTAGFEATLRVGVGLKYPVFRARGWHSPGVIGPFGSAAAVAKLIGLDEERLRNAFGLAGSQSAGSFAAWETPTVKFHQCRAALSGLMAALLAEQGFRASREILAHPDGGLFMAYSDGGDPKAAVADLGSRWEMERIALRLWPSASPLQTVITALLALIAAHDLKPETIGEVRIGMSRGQYDMHGNVGWEGRFKAMLSVHYTASVVLHDRRCWLEQYTPERYGDERVGRFAREKVKTEIDPKVEGTGVAVEVKTVDGRTFTDRRPVPRGDPTDPLSRAEIEGKLRTAAEGFMSADRVNRIAATVGALEKLGDVRELLALLRKP